MREMAKQKEGKIVLFILGISLVFQIFVNPYLGQIKFLFLGFMPMLWFVSVVNLIIWAIVLRIYLYKYWPYKDI
jgi:hypothetical protein